MAYRVAKADFDRLGPFLFLEWILEGSFDTLSIFELSRRHVAEVVKTFVGIKKSRTKRKS
jgi:hypothetical protein